MFSNANSGLVGGIGLILTALGFLATLWGLRATYQQLVKTKSASQAVNETTERLRSRSTFFDSTIETLKASKSLENALSHLGIRSWRPALQSLWEAQIALNRIFSELSNEEDRKSSKEAMEMFSRSIVELEQIADSTMAFDALPLMNTIRGQLILIDKFTMHLQRKIYND